MIKQLSFLRLRSIKYTTNFPPLSSTVIIYKIQACLWSHNYQDIQRKYNNI